MRSPCKCPDCEYISTRHWNVKSHIKKKHGGVGEPVRVYGRRELAISEQQSTLSHENSLQNLTNDNLELIEFESFKRNDWREMQLAKKFKAIVPQFSEFRQITKVTKIVRTSYPIYLSEKCHSCNYIPESCQSYE